MALILKVDHSLGATPLEVAEGGGGGHQPGVSKAGSVGEEGAATSSQLGRRSPAADPIIDQSQFLTEVDTDSAQLFSITDC